MTDVEALLERVRAATNRNRDLDLDIWMATNGLVVQPDRNIALAYGDFPYYTYSLDAIVGLIERKFPDCELEIRRTKIWCGTIWIQLGDLEECPPAGYGAHSEKALALCIAFLEALIAQEKESGK
jgi:hypothetical protein